jgi:hypothetical protein
VTDPSSTGYKRPDHFGGGGGGQVGSSFFGVAGRDQRASLSYLPSSGQSLMIGGLQGAENVLGRMFYSGSPTTCSNS